MRSIKIILTTALSMWMMQSFAQMPLESLRQMFADSAVCIECDYSTEVQNTKVVGHSEIIVQDDMYSMHGNGLEIYCDGKAVWTIDDSAKEVIIEPYDAADRDYAVNPVLVLADMDKLFKVRSSKALGAGSVSYSLDAVAECGVAEADVVLSGNGAVTKADFVLTDGSVLKVHVSSMKKTEEKQASFFSPDRRFGSDWIVTDLR